MAFPENGSMLVSVSIMIERGMISGYPDLFNASFSSFKWCS